MADNQDNEKPPQVLAERIQNDLSKAQYRYGVQDPFTDAQYYMSTANEMVAKADELGFTQFQGYSADRTVLQIRKIDGNWQSVTRNTYGEWDTKGGNSLSDIQAKNDHESLSAINERLSLRASVNQNVDKEIDKQMALADAFAFRRIQNPDMRESAALIISSNAYVNPEYKTGLEKAPGYPGVAKEVEEAALSNYEKQAREQSKGRAEINKPKPQEKDTQATNKIESEEIFTATNNGKNFTIPKDIAQKYKNIGEKYYELKNPDSVAFEDKGNRLETKSNSENMAESLVRIAESRGWDEIKVSGTDTFRREVWQEAAARGMTVKGYTPTEQDKVSVEKRVSETDYKKIEKENQSVHVREKAEENKIDPHLKQMADTFKNSPMNAATKHPELAGAVAVVEATNKKAVADGLNPQQRAIVAARVKENVVNSIERGDIPAIKIREEQTITQTNIKEQEYTR